MSTLDWVAATIAGYGYVALFAAAIIEGPIATVIGGFLASRGLFDMALVYAVAVAGDLTGDLLFYWVGRSGALALLASRSKFIERRRRRAEALIGRFRAHTAGTLLFGKLTHAAGFFVLLAAGAARVPLTTFLGYNLLGTLPKVALFVMIGYFAGAAYARINTYLGILSLVGFLLICLGIGIYLRRRLAFDRSEARLHARRGIH